MYRWEKGIDATWESVQEDAEGRLAVSSSDLDRLNLAKLKRSSASVKRGIIRYVVLGIDLSVSALEKDYRPSRLEASKNCIQQFIREFYDQNPISQLAIIQTRDRIAEKVSELSGHARSHLQSIQNLYRADGLASLQNLISLTIRVLKYVPNYGSKELLILFHSISTCDPGDIYETLSEAKAAGLRISLVCTSAEVFVCRQLATLTNGECTVALDAQHLHQLLMHHIVPPPSVQSNQEQNSAKNIAMGFPRLLLSQSDPVLGFEAGSNSGTRLHWLSTCYECPRCHTRTSDLPSQCAVCMLQLNSSSHIARSAHHLFPVPTFRAYIVRPRHPSKLETINVSVSERASSEQNEEKLVLRLGKRSRDVNSNSTNNNNSSNNNKLLLKTKNEEEWVAIPFDPQEQSTSHRVVEINQNSESSSVIRINDNNNNRRCAGCNFNIAEVDRIISQCPRCNGLFCVDCDLFIHDTLHNCPNCTM
jgi:transcription initiation factor TFIIH subunit 2